MNKKIPDPATNHQSKDITATYNEWKEFEGRQYTGMKIGRSHKWYYDQGAWKEKKSRESEGTGIYRGIEQLLPE